MIFFAGSPFLKTISVGIDMTSYLAAVTWFSSTFSFTTRKFSSSSLSSSRLGAMIRQGPHHGAQKSTSVGVSDSSTSAWKLESVTSGMFPAIGSPVQGRLATKSIVPRSRAPHPQRGHLPDRLDRDPRAHLRDTRLTITEDDRHLDDAEACLDRAVGELDLETVSARVDALQVELLEHLAAEALEATGEVAHGNAEHVARVRRAAAAEQPARQAPVADAAAAHVARAQHEVGVPRRLEQAR